MNNEEKHIYPIGSMHVPDSYDQHSIKEAIQEIKVLPRILDFCIENLDAIQLNTSYRENGWAIYQIIHHIADSHMNGFIRTKLALSEHNPTIKPYLQDEWVNTSDVSKIPVNYSITIIHALHHRWTTLFESLSELELKRTYFHPEYKKEIPIWEQIHSYAWHGKHHAEQIRQLRIRKEW